MVTRKEKALIGIVIIGFVFLVGVWVTAYLMTRWG